MAYSAHRRDALDASLPIAHRASHARSCANHVASRCKVHRDVIIERVRELTGVDLQAITSADDFEPVIAALERLRTNAAGG